MKLEIDVWHRLIDAYTKFQIIISKHVEKSLESLNRSKRRKNNRQSSENKIFAKAEFMSCKYTEGYYLCTKFENLESLCHDCKNAFDLLFLAVK